MRTDNWRPVTPKEPPLYEPVILCRIRDGKLVSEAGPGNVTAGGRFMEPGSRRSCAGSRCLRRRI